MSEEPHRLAWIDDLEPQDVEPLTPLPTRKEQFTQAAIDLLHYTIRMNPDTPCAAERAALRFMGVTDEPPAQEPRSPE